MTKDDAEPMAQLLERLYKLRAIALAELPPLVNRRLIEQAVIDHIVKGRGRDDLLSDLYALNTVFTGLRAKLGDRLWFTPADQDELNVGATALENAIIRQGVRSTKEKANLAMRSRMYTLFVNDYDQLRRYVSYCRWSNRDVDVFAPSLFAKRGSKKAAKAEANDGKAPKGPPKPNAPADSALPDDKRANEGETADSVGRSTEPALATDANKRVPQDAPFGRP